MLIIRSFKLLNEGEIPEWPNGVDCKSIGDAFVGSNPALPTQIQSQNQKFKLQKFEI